MIAAGVAAVLALGGGGWWLASSSGSPNPAPTAAPTSASDPGASSPAGAASTSTSDDGGSADAALLAPTRTINTPLCLGTLAFQPGTGRLVTIEIGGPLRLWNTATGKQEKTFTPGKNNSVRTAGFSTSGSELIGTGSFQTEVWKTTGTSAPRHIETGGTSMTSMAVGNGGRHVVTGSIIHNTLHFFDVTTGASLGTEDIGSPALAIRVTPDGKTVVVLTAKGLVFLDMGTSWSPRTLTKRTGAFSSTVSPSYNSLAVSGDNTTAASYSPDGYVQLWDITTGKPGEILDNGGSSSLTALAFSPDGKKLASGTTKQVDVWDVANRNVTASLKTETRNVDYLAFSPDGKTVAGIGSDGTINSVIGLWTLP